MNIELIELKNAEAQLRIARLNLDLFNAYPENKDDKNSNAYVIANALKSTIEALAILHVTIESKQS
jgi:hypothetical protein